MHNIILEIEEGMCYNQGKSWLMWEGYGSIRFESNSRIHKD